MEPDFTQSRPDARPLWFGSGRFGANHFVLVSGWLQLFRTWVGFRLSFDTCGPGLVATVTPY